MSFASLDPKSIFSDIPLLIGKLRPRQTFQYQVEVSILLTTRDIADRKFGKKLDENHFSTAIMSFAYLDPKFDFSATFGHMLEN